MTEQGADDGGGSTRPPSVLLIGYGNPLRGDDAVGRVVIETLPCDCRLPECRALSLHQLAPELAEELARADCAVFIDAAAGTVPGSVHVGPIAPRGAPVAGFTHHYEPGQLLYLAARLFGRAPSDCWLVTVGAGDFDCAERLSPAVAAAVPRVHSLLCDVLAGRSPQPGASASGPLAR